MIVPDYVRPIIGYRAWGWDPLFIAELKSFNGESWHPGRALRGTCRILGVGPPSPHRAPVETCRCGIYALKSAWPCLHTAFVYGEVYLWGKVVEHKYGWRAQFAYPKSFVLSRSTWLRGIDCIVREDIERRLEPLTRYGVKIFLRENDLKLNAALLWTPCSGYDEDVLDRALRPLEIQGKPN